MNPIIALVGLVFLVIISVVDLLSFNKKGGYIPSILTTLFLLVGLLQGEVKAVLILGVVAWLLTDLDQWGGIADFKVFVAAGAFFPTVLCGLAFTILVTLFSVVFKTAALHLKWRSIPFIPVIALAYVVGMMYIVL